MAALKQKIWVPFTRLCNFLEPPAASICPRGVRPAVELGDSLKQEGVVNPLPALMNSSEGKYTGQAALKSCKVEFQVEPVYN